MYIVNPITHKTIFLNNHSNYEDRLEVLNRKFFNNKKDKILKYCRQNNKIKNKLQLNSYYTAERILENMATYLLRGQFEEHNIMTIFDIRNASIKEVPASCSNSNAEDLIYSNSSSQDENNLATTATFELTHCTAEVPEYEMNSKQLKSKNKRLKKQLKRYKQTNTYKFEKLHSTTPVKTYRLKTLKENDVTYEYYLKDKEYDRKTLHIETENKNKPFKNAWGQPVWSVEYITIGGNKGIIPLDKNYKFKWATVNTDNEFEFMDKKYIIDKSVKQYEVKDDNKCEMDKILCYYIPNEDKYYFFDMNIEQIDNKLIKQV